MKQACIQISNQIPGLFGQKEVLMNTFGNKVQKKLIEIVFNKMKDEVLLEMMASIIQEMYDEGYGSEFRPAMQNVLVAFNNRGLTPRAADECLGSSDGKHEFYQGSTWRICAHCGTRR